MKRMILGIIHAYQCLFSRGILKAVFLTSGCRFSPSCSEYTYQAIEKYGTIKGLFLGLRRILRCQPYFPGGCDPIK